MKILVVGSGGREHALVWKLAQSSRVKKIFCAPGNGGISQHAECVDISATDIKGLVRFAVKNKVDLTVVGPESSLTLGIVETFEKKGLRIFGPTSKGAILEGSKVFTKKFMRKYNIPSADFRTFRSGSAAVKYIKQKGAPIVIKADGLAAGKGVIVAQSIEEAVDAVNQIMNDKVFGEAGNRVVVEEFMTGEEASFLAFTDGKTILPLPTSQDHKAVYDNDQGPNTGGMGAYSPAPVVTDVVSKQVMDEIMIPAVKAMAKEGRPYKGILYAGLMISKGRARVVEFNCRFGDPEAQPLLMRIENDLVDVIEAVVDERLDEINLKVDPRPTVCVVMSAAGYPGSYKKGYHIRGLRKASSQSDVFVFHAGTSRQGRKIVTSGGRVLGVTALGGSLDKAIANAYRAVQVIKWAGCYYRNDIGAKAARHTGNAPDDIPLVGIVMGSDSDLPIMNAAADFLKSMNISYKMIVASAHRTPERAARFASEAQQNGIKVIIAGAGMAAHLAGVLAAHTTLPVIGVPIDASSLNGLDSLLSTVQMPPGIPVATMGIGKSGAQNAAILVTQILALSDPSLSDRLVVFKETMAREVEKKSAAVEKNN